MYICTSLCIYVQPQLFAEYNLLVLDADRFCPPQWSSTEVAYGHIYHISECFAAVYEARSLCTIVGALPNSVCITL